MQDFIRQSAIHWPRHAQPRRPVLRPFLAASLALLLNAGPAMAAETTAASYDPPAIFSVFGTLGMTHASADGGAFIRDITQFHGADNKGLHWEQDTKLGAQANIAWTENLEGVVQVLSRYRQTNEFQPEVTWAFLKYIANDHVEARAGRVGYDIYPGADTRNVGFSYLWVRPSIEYFGTLLYPYLDGGDFTLKTEAGRGQVRFKAYGGLTRTKVSALQSQRDWAGGISLPPANLVQDMEGARIKGGFVEYQDRYWTFRLGGSQTSLNKEFPSGGFSIDGLAQGEINQANASNNPALASTLATFREGMRLTGKKATFKAANLVYEDGPFQFHASLGQMTSDALLVPNYKSGYLLTGYRFGKLTPYASVSAIRTRISDLPDVMARQGASVLLSSMAKFSISSPALTQTTFSLGARYDISPNWAVKVQVDHLRNKNCSPVSLPMTSANEACAPPLLWPVVPVDWNRRATLYTAVLDFYF